MTSIPLSEPSRAFASIALAAVAWDGILTMAGTRALRHVLDYRAQFRTLDDAAMVSLLDQLLADLRLKGAQHVMVDAASLLDSDQRQTAYAVAVEIMRSDGPLHDDERNILMNLAVALNLPIELTAQINWVMDILHASVVS